MIHISNLNFCYKKQDQLFHNLSFSEGAGSIVGLLGKNGAGKSTLLKLITGLLVAQKDSISVMGVTPFRRIPSFLEEVYFIPEEYHLPSVRISQFIRANALFYPRFDHVKLTKILTDFELDINNHLLKLSQGQRKKFLIAFALSTNCRLLLFDEPTCGLDIPSKSVFRKTLAGSLSEEQLVIISTHQVKDMENLINRIVIIDKGNIIFNQNTWEVIEKYAFSTVTSLEDKEYLYHEVDPGGYKILSHANGTPTEVDIEMLFNACIKGALNNQIK